MGAEPGSSGRLVPPEARSECRGPLAGSPGPSHSHRPLPLQTWGLRDTDTTHSHGWLATGLEKGLGS